jgi:hypothetical protein
VDAGYDDGGHQGKEAGKDDEGNNVVAIHRSTRFPKCGNGSRESAAKQPIGGVRSLTIPSRSSASQKVDQFFETSDSYQGFASAMPI